MSQTYHLIGDVHGNSAQLHELLHKLGYQQPDAASDPHLWLAPKGCVLVSVGDLVDRGPNNVDCLRTIMRMVQEGQALFVIGNHEWNFRRLLRYEVGLEEERVRVSPARLMSYVEILGLTTPDKQELLQFLDDSPLYLELADGQLLVTHARWEGTFRDLEGEELVRACAFGDTDLEDPDSGDMHLDDVPDLPDAAYVELPANVALPDRARWTRQWQGPAEVVWGHQMVLADRVVRIGNTINVESGCFMGHALSAYVFPQRHVVQVHGAQHWKSHLRRYGGAVDMAYPSSLSDVAAVVRELGLQSSDDCLAWLQLELERREDAASPTPELLHKHRALFARALESTSK
jgi:protein phosphatase